MTTISWLKHYHGAVYDPKFKVAALRVGSTRCNALSVWWASLEYASEQEDRGSILGLNAEVIAAGLDLMADEVSRLLDAFIEIGLIAGNRIAKWAKRNGIAAVETVKRAVSSAARRQAAYRARKSEARAAVLQEVAAREPELPLSGGITALRFEPLPVTTDEEEDHSVSSREETAATAAPEDPPDPVKKLFDDGVRLLVEAAVDNRRARALLGSWRRTFGDGAVTAAIALCEEQAASDPVSFIAACLQKSRRSQAEVIPFNGGEAYASARYPARQSAHRAHAERYRRLGAALCNNGDLSGEWILPSANRPEVGASASFG